MYTPAEEIGLSGQRLAARVQTAIDSIPPDEMIEETANIPVKSFHVLDKNGDLQVVPFYIVMGIAPSHYGVAMFVRASQGKVVNIAQQGGMCAVMVSAKALHTSMYRTQSTKR